MGMNIKNVETERLTRELAQATGESLTTAVTTAVRERLDRLRAEEEAPSAQQRAERILAVGGQIADRLNGPSATAEHGDMRYEGHGLSA